MGKFCLSYKRIENVCNSTSKKSKRSFFKEAAKHGTIISRKYINTVQPFLSNKSCVFNDFITIDQDEDQISTEQELVKLFNEHYTNIRRNSSGKNAYH